jgi:hypothetical protein
LGDFFGDRPIQHTADHFHGSVGHHGRAPINDTMQNDLHVGARDLVRLQSPMTGKTSRSRVSLSRHHDRLLGFAYSSM